VTPQQLEAHERLRRRLGPAQPPSKAGCVLPIVVACIVVFFLFFSPRTCLMHQSTEDQMALEAVNKCDVARKHLGDDIHPAWAGCTTGKSSCSDFRNASASWRFPISGSKGRGDLRFSASKRKGKWKLVFATIVLDEDHSIDVMKCEEQVIPD
jgi:hypothetical protein